MQWESWHTPLLELACALPSPFTFAWLCLAKKSWQPAQGPCKRLWWRVTCQGGFCDLRRSFITSLTLIGLIYTTEGFGPCTRLKSVCNTSDLMTVYSLILLTLISTQWTVMYSRHPSALLWFGGFSVAVFEARLGAWNTISLDFPASRRRTFAL